MTDDRSWYIVERWQRFEGEIRANQLRVLGIGLCYLVHLWSYLGSQGWLPRGSFLQLSQQDAIDRRFHLLVSLLAMTWCLSAVLMNVALRERYFPAWLPTASTLVDVVCLTCVLCISSGPRSPLILGYLLIIIVAALRFSLPLVRLATIAGLLGYVCVLGSAKWPESFGLSAEPPRGVPRYQQLLVLLEIGLGGIMVGQVVRRVRRMAEQYAQRQGN